MIVLKAQGKLVFRRRLIVPRSDLGGAVRMSEPVGLPQNLSSDNSFDIMPREWKGRIQRLHMACSLHKYRNAISAFAIAMIGRRVHAKAGTAPAHGIPDAPRSYEPLSQEQSSTVHAFA